MVDKNGVEYVFEAQTSLHMRRPLLFGKPVSMTAQQWYQLDKQKRVRDAVKGTDGAEAMSRDYSQSKGGRLSEPGSGMGCGTC